MINRPRPDQLRDFIAHRLTRVLGRRPGAAHRAARLLPGRSGAALDSLTAYAVQLERLDDGEQIPVRELLEVITLQLDRADSVDGKRQAVLVDRALRLAFHPSAQYGPSGSPLMLETDRFLAPFRASSAAQRMLFDLDRTLPARISTTPIDGRARRVLVLCHSSWTFIDRVIDDLQTSSDVEFRKVDVSALPLSERPTHALAVRMREEWNREGALRPVPSALEADLDWADTVFVEWGTYPFAWYSFLDTARFAVRTVARLHRFEMLTPYPMLARSGAYDEIAFVSPPLRSFLRSVSPRLGQAGGTTLLRNVHDLDRFSPSDERDLFSLVQIGWATPIKEVSFSLEILRRLRTVDQRYSLTLVGPTPERNSSRSTAQWATGLLQQIDELGESVRVLGFRKDVPEILAGTGFLLSSSGNEGTHESVAEAAAAGCVPVVRDWPEISPWGGAETIYPQEWIIEDVEGAVARVLALSDPRQHEETSQEAQRWIRAHRDSAEIRSEYLTFIGSAEPNDRSDGLGKS